MSIKIFNNIINKYIDQDVVNTLWKPQKKLRDKFLIEEKSFFPRSATLSMLNFEYNIKNLINISAI